MLFLEAVELGPGVAHGVAPVGAALDEETDELELAKLKLEVTAALFERGGFETGPVDCWSEVAAVHGGEDFVHCLEFVLEVWGDVDGGGFGEEAVGDGELAFAD